MYEKIIQGIETLLFVVGDEGITAKDLSEMLKCSIDTIKNCVSQLEASYESNQASGLHIMETGNRYTLSTKKEMADLLKTYATSPLSHTISQAALETLSIVAYKQPISRAQVDEVRGVNSHGAMQRLIQSRLIEKKGRMDVPGRPILYGTTDYFLDYFGLRTMEDLPDISKMEEEMSQEIPQDLFFERFEGKELLLEESENE